MNPLGSTRTTATALLVVETVAVACQVAQHTDPRFPLVYFSVDSAVLAALAAAVMLAWPRWPHLSSLKVAAAVGVVLSAVVFAAVIAPSSPTGSWIQPHDDAWVRIATILMHGLATVLVVAVVVPENNRLSLSRCAAISYAWPLTYLVVLLSLAAPGWLAIPYPFLQSTRVGWPAVAAVVVTLAAVIILICGGLWSVQRLARQCQR